MSAYKDSLRGEVLERRLVFSGVAQPMDYVCAACLSVVDREIGCVYCDNRIEKVVVATEQQVAKREEIRVLEGRPKRGRGRPKGSHNKPKRRA